MSLAALFRYETYREWNILWVAEHPWERKDDGMRVLKVFLVGLLYGWFLRWIVDAIFLNDTLRLLSNENALLKQRIQSLEAPRAIERFRERQIETAALPVVDAPPVNKDEPVVPHRDDLKLIKGVGPQIEKKLNNAGVHTFDQMSRLTIEELKAILGLNKRVVQNAENLLSQARKFVDAGPKG
jgi:predicted flap endonuclease-1-like 5' DNA nuclease